MPIYPFTGLAFVFLVKHFLYLLACFLVKGRRQPLLCFSLALGDKLRIVFHINVCFKFLIITICTTKVTIYPEK